jgi:tetratricopeptide (TPR) repeat protein
MHLVCSKCGATCVLEEPARGKKARTFAGCASCGHLNRVPRATKASRERDDASERHLEIAATAASAARALGGSGAPGKATLIGVGARVSATDLLARATPQPPMVSPTPPPSRARISTPPVADEALADTMRAPIAEDDIEDDDAVDDDVTEKVPDVAPVSERRPADKAKTPPPDADEEDEDEDEEEDAPPPAARKAAPVAVAASKPAVAKAAPSAQPSAPRRGFLLPVVAIAASIAIVYVAVHRDPAPASTSQPAGSADGLLEQAERALDDGDSALAIERVGQAEAMAKSPRTLLERARIDAAIADAAWLHARLVAAPGAPPAAVPAAGAARASAVAAEAAAPTDPAAARAKLDALRIAGDLEGARALVPRLAAIGEQSETAYVTAALELAEEAPVSLGAVARLREAVASGHQATRARSALAYALARSGDPAGARHEIEALAAKKSDAPVIADLRAFLAARADHSAKPAVTAAPPIVSAVAIVAPPTVTTTTPPASAIVATTTPATTSAPAKATEKPTSMDAAVAAQKSGDLARATTLYKALIAKSPNDIESLTALGDIARSERRTGEAIGYYRRALLVNASFFPALLGLADALWDSGERAAAQQRYTEITTRFSPSMYPTYVRQRIAADAGTR